MAEPVCQDCDGEGEAPRSLLGACLECPTCGGTGKVKPADDGGRVPHRERCRRECTRDVIFLLRSRTNRKKNAADNWRVEGVYLTREEGEEFAKAHSYRYPHGWQVYGVCAEGELAVLLRGT